MHHAIELDLGLGVGPVVDFHQARGIDGRVGLRRGQGRMPQQFLDRAQVTASRQQMRRERVAHRMRGRCCR